MAYTNPDDDPNTGTTLYDIDSNLDILATQDPPNNGTLNTRGSLGVNTADVVGFNIRGDRDGLAALQAGSAARLYSIDLDSGRARDRGQIGSGEQIDGLTIPIDNDRGSRNSGGWDGGGRR